MIGLGRCVVLPPISPCSCRDNGQIVEVSRQRRSKSLVLDTFQVFDESVVEMSNGQLVRIPELGSRLVVGEKGSVRIIPFYGDFSVKRFLGHSSAST
jgi:hypothetical protein